jgi:hypothetical protein
MPTKDYRDDLKQERETLAKLLGEREEIEVKIARGKKRIAALAELCDESEFAEQVMDLDLGGLTDVCRTVLRASRKPWMSISEIQEAIKELGFPLDQYKAATASITTTVNRLVDGQEVVMDKLPQGGSGYKWVGRTLPFLRALMGIPLDPNLVPESVRKYVVSKGEDQKPKPEHPMRKAFGGPSNRSAFYGGGEKPTVGEQIKRALGGEKKK